MTTNTMSNTTMSNTMMSNDMMADPMPGNEMAPLPTPTSTPDAMNNETTTPTPPR